MKNKLIQLTPLFFLLVAWELLSRCGFSSLFSSPYEIVSLLCTQVLSGDIIYHFAVTGFEALIGLLLGLIIGCIIGFLLIYYKSFSKIGRPYIYALSSIPTFALAPLMIIWFGVGIGMKIVLAFLATVFTTIFQTYEGANKVPKNDMAFFELNGANKHETFWLLSFPASLDWIIQSLKLNAGFSILGAFIGEFIASEAGLGYIILKASGLYDTTYVFVAIICIIILSSVFTLLANVVIRYKLNILRGMTNFFSDKPVLNHYAKSEITKEANQERH